MTAHDTPPQLVRQEVSRISSDLYEAADGVDEAVNAMYSPGADPSDRYAEVRALAAQAARAAAALLAVLDPD